MVGILRFFTEGSGWASIWITLVGVGLDNSAIDLLLPRRATGVRGFHIWWGGVAGGVSAAWEIDVKIKSHASFEKINVVKLPSVLYFICIRVNPFLLIL